MVVTVADGVTSTECGSQGVEVMCTGQLSKRPPPSICKPKEGREGGKERREGRRGEGRAERIDTRGLARPQGMRKANCPLIIGSVSTQEFQTPTCMLPMDENLFLMDENIFLMDENAEVWQKGGFPPGTCWISRFLVSDWNGHQLL